MSFYSVMHKIFAGAVRLLYRVEVIGRENEPELSKGGVILCSNHLSNSDVLVLAASFKRQVCFFAKAELFKIPLLAQLIKALGAFPVKRGAADVSAVKKTVSIVRDGGVVGFFPQGTRYPGIHPRQTTPRSGIGMIAARSQALILPVAIVTHDLKVRPFRRTKVVIGKAIEYDELGFPRAEEDGTRPVIPSSEYTRVADIVFTRIVELVDENLF